MEGVVNGKRCEATKAHTSRAVHAVIGTALRSQSELVQGPGPRHLGRGCSEYVVGARGCDETPVSQAGGADPGPKVPGQSQLPGMSKTLRCR